MNLQNQILAAIATFIFGAFASWWVTSDYYQARYDAAVARQKAEAVAVLQEATERAIAAERLNNKLAQTLEVSHAQNRQKLDAALSDNRRLSRELGGLRDPFAIASSCAVPATTAGPGLVAPAAATGRLSVEASEFLLEFAREADRAAEYAATCYRWIEEVNGRR